MTKIRFLTKFVVCYLLKNWGGSIIKIDLTYDIHIIREKKKWTSFLVSIQEKKQMDFTFVHRKSDCGDAQKDKRVEMDDELAAAHFLLQKIRK